MMIGSLPCWTRFHCLFSVLLNEYENCTYWVLFLQHFKIYLLERQISNRDIQIQRGWSSICLFTPQEPATAGLGQAEAMHLELKPGLPHGCRDTNTWAITHCFLGCTLARSWKQKQSQNSSPGTLIHDVGLPRDTLTPATPTFYSGIWNWPDSELTWIF